MESQVQIEDDGKPFDYTRMLIAYSDAEAIDGDRMISALERFWAVRFTEFKLDKTDVKIYRLDNRQYSVDEAILALQRDQQFAKVTFERDMRASPLAGAANDRYYDDQWALQAIGVEAAWRRVAEAGQGRGPVRVAIIDSGAKPDHEDLDLTLLTGTREPSGTDFADDIGHGTMLAGTIAAVADNALGIAGVASNPIPPSGGGARVPDLRLFAVKFDDMRTPPSAILAILGVLDAIIQQVRVINVSWHLLDVQGLLKIAGDGVERARREGGIFQLWRQCRSRRAGNAHPQHLDLFRAAAGAAESALQPSLPRGQRHLGGGGPCHRCGRASAGDRRLDTARNS